MGKLLLEFRESSLKIRNSSLERSLACLYLDCALMKLTYNDVVYYQPNL